MNEDIEIEFEDTRRGIKFRIKGKPEVVEANMEKYGYSTTIKEATSQPVQITAPEAAVENSTALSSINVPEKPQQAETLTQYIIALVCSNWGVRGRSSTDIIEVARAHGMALPMSTLSGILHGLVKNGKLRRDKSAGEDQWKYYPPLSVAMRL